MTKTFPTYYEQYAAAGWRRYTGAGFCEGDTHYYRMFARSNDSPQQQYARRGVIGWKGCCVECERCDCWCQSGYLFRPDMYDPHQDASFGTTDYETFRDMNVNISGVNPCSDEPLSDCEQWIIDHWGSVGINGDYTLQWITRYGTPSFVCSWKWTGGTFDIGNCRIYKEVSVSVCYADGNFSAGEWIVQGQIDVEEIDPEEPPCPCSGPFSFYYHKTGGGDGRPYCSDATFNFPNQQDCDLAGHRGEGGQARVTWNIKDLQTPDYYIATFSGDIIACDDCPANAIITAAIEELINPSGIILPLIGSSRCGWRSPPQQVPGYDGWYWYAALVQSSEPDDETEWKISVVIIDYRHKHGIPEYKWSCSRDWDMHLFFRGTATIGIGNCQNPPSISNSLDCEDEHLGSGAEAQLYSPCGKGGSCGLTAG